MFKVYKNNKNYAKIFKVYVNQYFCPKNYHPPSSQKCMLFTTVKMLTL